MAIKSAKLLRELFLETFQQDDFQRERLEMMYTRKWEETLTMQPQIGWLIQKFLLLPATANIGLKLACAFHSILLKIVKRTKGDLFI